MLPLSPIQLFVQSLSRVSDPRSKRGVSQPFPTVLTITVLVLLANVLVCAKNPLHIRHYARSLGTYAKTDKNDAKIIAQYALERKADAMQAVSKQQLALKELLASRRRFVVQRLPLLNQLQTVTQRLVIKETKSSIEQTQKHIEHLEAAIDEIIANDDAWQEQSELLQSVPGIGKEPFPEYHLH